MSTTPKTRKKKLHGQDKSVEVDEQILRWRKKLKARGVVLGKGMEAAKRDAERMVKQRATDTPEKLLKKKWFG